MDLRFAEVFFSAVPSLIVLAAWVVAVVFAAMMVKNGGRPERFLLIGTCLMLAGILVSITVVILNPFIVTRLAESGISRVRFAGVFGAIGIFRSCLSLAGIVLLVLAFWQKFKAGHAPVVSE